MPKNTVAAKLNNTEQPVAKPVTVSKPAPEKKETATPSSSKKNKYYIIVSSLPTANDAQQVLNEYKQKGYKDVTIIEGNGRYRLSLCNFADKAAAYKKLNELKQNEDIIQLLYIAEQCLGKALSPTEIQKILFFYDGLGMPADLIEYLIEYCVSRNHKSIRYIETVALAWTQEGITSVEEAKKSGSRYTREYFSILKSLGITNRNPVDTEISLMDTWLKTYGFSVF